MPIAGKPTKVVTPLPLTWRLVLLFVLSVAVSVILEALIFSTQSLQNYPLYLPVETWITKHVLIGLLVVITAVVMEWLWSQRKIVLIYERSRLLLVIVLVIASIIYLQLSQWVPEYVRGGVFLIGCQSFNCLLRFVFYPAGLVMAIGVLGVSWLFYRDPNFKLALLFGGPVGAIVLLLLLGQIFWQSQLNQQIPMQSAIARTKTVALSQGSPLLISVYNREKPPGSLSEEETVFNNKTDLAPFYVVSPNFTPQKWHQICNGYALSSFGLQIMGAGVATTCDYIGAVVYKQPALCDATPYRKECRTDVAVVTKDPTICQGDSFCVKHPLVQR